MPVMTITLPTQKSQTEFNLGRWASILADPDLGRIEGRIETDRHGRVIMSPPPAPRHGRFQVKKAQLLEARLPAGETISECPISTADGVKAADVAWASADSIAQLGRNTCFPRSPEICVEILSPANSQEEIEEKMALYFDAGAREVWVCGSFGEMTFFALGMVKLEASQLCPSFPSRIEVNWPK
jgi:Uma2 family endonuclease